ncbi:unnamed protein product [Bursaphelenchus xylophilus]|uniref:(pine wood nematode) hypothetical protein n=1 Tax=Bursaphelenchus xylophilus TaxID=6326 RepID=A0A811LVG9_BURXY|nr:unnamed protein product [Bursaphelenchus xylophilus]CAG9124045.1 unnamed protein product [Bursaphelenchus xylophilus]
MFLFLNILSLSRTMNENEPDQSSGSFHEVSLAGLPDPIMTIKTKKERAPSDKQPAITPKGYVIIVVLFTINLLNYMDRLTISAVLTSVTRYYDLTSSQGGLLQTVFIVFFMAVAPICGWLGDRYNRKWIMVGGLLVWIAAVLASTFVPSNMFYLFLFFRGMVGTGEASYSVIAPTVIADMFKSTVRSKVLMVFYLAIPLGSGLGYMVGSTISSAMGAWQWGLRVTPIFGAVCVFILVLFVEEPEREVLEKVKDDENASIWKDITYLLKNKTYFFSTWGYTFIIFAVGTLSWWAPSTIEYAIADRNGLNSTEDLEPSEKDSVGTIFGGITLISGLVGVITGTLFATAWKNGTYCFKNHSSIRADVFVCIIGSVIATPLLFVALYTIDVGLTLAYIFIFFTTTSLSLNWACNVDLLMYIVVPRKRNIASAVQTSVGHAFGDASGPYIVGFISDLISKGDSSPGTKFTSLRTAFLLPNALLVLSGIMYIIAAFTLPHDLSKLENIEIQYHKGTETINSIKKLKNTVGDSTKEKYMQQEY